MSLQFKLPDVLTKLPFADRLPHIGRPRRIKPPKPVNCLNCGQMLLGKFCSHCGQEAEDHRTAVWPLIADALSEFARWDSKLFRTLIPILVRPGYLTNEYNSGKRVSYISPFKMYLTVSVIFFFILFQHSSYNQLSHHIHMDTSTIHTPGIVIKTNTDKKQLEDTKKQLAAQATANKDNLAGPILSESASVIGEAEKTAPSPVISKKPTRHDPYAAIPKLIPNIDGHAKLFNGDTVFFGQLPKTYPEYMTLQNQPGYPYKNRPLTQSLVKKFYAIYSDHTLLIAQIEDILPKAMFVLLPLFAFLLYVLYWRNGRYYVEHLVYTLHNHTLVFIAFTAMIFSPAWLQTIISVAIPIYLFASMLVVYRQSWIKTLVKFCILGFNYTVIMSIAVFAVIIAAFFLA